MTDYILGFSLIFVLGLGLTILTSRSLDFRHLMVWLLVFSGFMVRAGLVDLWVLIMFLIGNVIMVLDYIKRRRFR